MRSVDDDQAIQHFRIDQREGPRYYAAPVMGDQREFLVATAAEMGGQAADVFHEIF